MSEFYGNCDDESFDNIDITTTMFGTKFNSVLWNASGVMCTEYQELQTILDSPYTGAVVTKSCTLKPRAGNPEPRYADSKSTKTRGNWSINSMGIPNNGIDYYIQGVTSSMTPKLKRNDKPYFISISGLSVIENLEMIDRIRTAKSLIDAKCAVELNLSCPNIVGKAQLCYDFEGMEDTLRKLFDGSHELRIPIGLKMSPYFDISHFNSAVDVLEPFSNRLSFLTCSNSIGNGMLIDADTESTLIYPKHGLGGCGGDPMRPVALSNVYTFNNLLGEKLDIIGCGGVNNGDDVFNLILAGAKGVQVGTFLARKGVESFKYLTDDLKRRMKKNGYENIEEFRGKVKRINPKL